jgi:hypothetical protein
MSLLLRATPDDLSGLKSLIVVDLNLGQKTSYCKAFAIRRVIYALILILRVERYFLTSVIHGRPPAHNASVTHRPQELVVFCVITPVLLPGETCHWEAGHLVFY